MQKPDNIFFRVRENGALVFKVDTENRQNRIEMDQIAIVNINSGNIKPQGDHELTPEETARIESWIQERQTILTDRYKDDVRRAIDLLGNTAHWMNSKASDDEIDELGNDLLMAMHDLRSVLVRKMSDKLRKEMSLPKG